MSIKVHNLAVMYPDGTKALDDVGFVINEGESAALMGGNGAGKTSLLLALSGILEPESGTVEIDGIELNKKNANEIRKRMGMVFQNPDDQLFMPLLYDDIAFGCRNFGLPEDEVELRVGDALNALGISRLAKRSSLKLSWGEKRMAAMATVLSMQPKIVLFDEPTAFLDPRARRALINALKQMRHTKLIATHDIDFAAEVCDRAVILCEGRMAAEGTADLLYDPEIMRSCGLEEAKR